MTLFRFGWLLTVLLSLVRTAAGGVTEHWYVLDLMGQRAGWMHSVKSESDTEIKNDSTMSLSIKRGALELAIKIESSFVETPDGKPISIRTIQSQGQEPIEQLYVFKPDGIEVTTKQNGQSKKSQMAQPEGEWLTPEAAERFMKKRRKEGATEVTFRTIDPSVGIKPVDVTRKTIEKTTVKAMGKDFEVVKSAVTVSAAPGITTFEYSDVEDSLVRSDTKMGILDMTMTLATEAEARGEIKAPEMMVSTLVKPEGVIPHPRTCKQASYTLSVPEGELPVIIATGAQRVRKIDEKTLRVTVDTTSRDAAPDTDATNPAFLASTALADLRDARIVALQNEALKDAPEEPEKRAEVLRRFVYRYITNKSMNVAYASASETARTREGDCTEHGVLLATLLRADHIPARVVGGLIYADEFAGGQHIFGYHMWAQALLELDGAKRWVDLDGAISPTIAFDATHIAVATSDLADGDNVGALVSLAPMLGRLRIKIESVGPIPDAAPSQGKADGKEKK